MDGTGENPTLNHGYANCMLCCWFMNLVWQSILLASAVCEIVGNVPNPEKHDESPTVGNDMSAVSMSVESAKLFSKLVNELFWTSVGNPQDIGTSDAQAGAVSIATTAAMKSTIASLFTIMTTLLFVKNIY